jgi:multidrug efflux pump subunit AcrA (membrane-fusion protein)
MGKRDLAILMILFLSVSCKNREPRITTSEAVHVRVTEVTSGEISIPVHSTGVLVSSEEYKLSFKTGGIIGKIYVKEGERVKKGKMLASLRLDEIAANESQAKSGYEKALRDYQRAENLYRDTVATLEQKQNAATALSVAKSALEIVQFNLAHSSILAPDDGIVLRK